MQTSLVVGGVFLVLLGVTLYKSICVVNEGELKALVVFGEMDAVLKPGLNFVPPFASKVYPIDTDNMVMETGEGIKNIPQEYIQDIRTSDVFER